MDKWRAGWVVGLLCLLLLWGCNTTPALKIYDQAKALGLSNSVVLGTHFSHVIFFHRMNFIHASDSVHIYIEGDGKPFIGTTRVAADPTPGNPLALRLMSRDNRPSVYIGRPCYFGFATTPPCSPKYWTTHRYAPEVIDSMEAAIRGFLGAHRSKHLVFIGYSGGAPLAMLLAPHFHQTKAVVTIGGDIDTTAWTDHHRYTPLSGSINPAHAQPLNRRIFQLHLAGEKDKVVPPEIIQPEAQRQTGGNVTVYDNFDHVCCWERVWPDILHRYGFSYIQGGR